MCLVSEVTIRPAGAMDVVRIAEIIHGEPSPETIGLAGDRRLASAFGQGLVELDHIPNSISGMWSVDCAAAPSTLHAYGESRWESNHGK